MGRIISSRSVGKIITILRFTVDASKSKIIDYRSRETCVIISSQVQYETDQILLFRPSWDSDVVTTSLLTLSQRCGTVENESYTDVSFQRCDNVALQRCQDVASTLLQRRHNIKHWITSPFYYGLFCFLSLQRNVKVTKALSDIKHASFLFKKTLYL